MLTDQRLPAQKKMSKARINLVLDDVFAGALSMKMDMRELTPEEEAAFQIHWNQPATCCTNGRQIKWARSYIDKLDVQQCKGLIAHEVYHVVFKHHLRRGGRDPHWWNIAGDKVIDSILSEAGYQVPDSMADSQYIDKSTEEVYNLIKPPVGGGGKGGGKQTGSGGGSGKANAPPQQPSKSGQGGNQPQPQQSPPTPPKISGGVVEDAPINMQDKAQLQQFEEDLQIAIEQAAKAAKAAGSLPAQIDRMVTTEKEHVVNWRDLLRDFMEKCSMPGDYTWQRPNRRFLSHGYYLPSLDEELENPKIIVACDTSGSVGQTELLQYAAEISGILGEFPNCEFEVLYGDTKVAHTQKFTQDDLPIRLEARGGGGTKFMPFFDWIHEHKVEAEAMIFFTDMGAFDWDEVEDMGEPGIPVLWLNTYPSEDDRKVPFGQIIPLRLKDD